MAYKLVIYDFDGTLADTLPYLLSVFDHLAGRYRLPRYDPAELDALRGLDARQILQRFHVPLWKFTLAGLDYRRMMNRDAHMIPLFPGVEDLIQSLAVKGIQQAMVSSNGRKIIERVLGSHNAGHISQYECRVSILGKADKIRKVLRKSEVEPAQAIYIGDELRDMHAARSEGVAFGAVTWGYTLPEALQAHSPDWLFHSVDDVMEMIG